MDEDFPDLVDSLGIDVAIRMGAWLKRHYSIWLLRKGEVAFGYPAAQELSIGCFCPDTPYTLRKLPRPEFIEVHKFSGIKAGHLPARQFQLTFLNKLEIGRYPFLGFLYRVAFKTK